MSQENVEQYQRMAGALESHDLDAFLTLFDRDVDFAFRSLEVDGGSSYRGHNGIRTWWESTFTVFSDYRAEIDDVQDLGEVTFRRVRLLGHGMESGAPIEQTHWHVVKWRHGVVVRWRSFLSESDALEAAGLLE